MAAQPTSTSTGVRAATARRKPADVETAVRRVLEQAYGQGKLHVIDELTAPDVTGSTDIDCATGDGRSGIKQRAARARASIFDLEFDAGSFEMTGDTFVLEWTAEGVLERPLMGFEPVCDVGGVGAAPTGPEVTIGGTVRGRISADGIAEWTMDWSRPSP